MDLCIDKLKKILPKQGPLDYFVHHNTLSYFDNKPFKEGIELGSKIYGGEVLRPEQEYLNDYKNNKIKQSVFDQTIEDFCLQNGLDILSHKQIAKDILLSSEKIKKPTHILNPELLDLYKNKDSQKIFIRDILKDRYGVDVDTTISPLIYRFLAHYFDHGVSYWKMPGRSGLLKTFCYYYGTSSVLAPRWEKQLAQNLVLYKDTKAEAVMEDILQKLKLENEAYDYLLDLSLRYRGWGGLVLSFEKHPEWNLVEGLESSFTDFLAVILLCEYSFFSSLDVKKQMKVLSDLPVYKETSKYSTSFLFHIENLIQDNQDKKKEILECVEKLSDFERRYLWHIAYEESFYDDFTTAVSYRMSKAEPSSTKSKYQVICCIDDREESFRRHIENQGGETFGIAGHFTLDIKYKGIFSAQYRNLCPDTVSPTKHLKEKIVKGHINHKYSSTYGKYLETKFTGSRTIFKSLLTQVVSAVEDFSMLSLAIASPFYNYKVKNEFSKRTVQKVKTELHIDENEFDEVKMFNHAASFLKTIGLVKNFAPKVIILGHGSSSFNNPHESAYNCGACGGGRGAPNARLIARILNSEKVRQLLAVDGIIIPEDTQFIGGFHNTCTDKVEFFDADLSDVDVKSAIKNIQTAARQNAYERTRRFEDVAPIKNETKAYKHTLERANSYMQPRPEYNHATNSYCVIGPRSFSKSLFLDRRSFLCSYDPTIDESGAILKGILSAAGPVCSGINLEYYFSKMDNSVFGCGTKLAHNVTSLLGVMNGYQSDLLLGLNEQMVEIHEPYRLMMMVTSTTEMIEKMFVEVESFGRLVKNKWIHLLVQDYKKNKLYRYSQSGFIEVKNNSVTPAIYNPEPSTYVSKRGPVVIGVLEAV